MYYTYIIRCMDNTYYIGYTSDINRRMEEQKKVLNVSIVELEGLKN